MTAGARWWQGPATLVFPRVCPVCLQREPLPEVGACAACFQSLEFLRAPICPGCGGENDTVVECCRECLQSPRRWRRAVSVFRFDGQARQVIHRYKYRGEVALVRFLAKQAARAWRERGGAPPPAVAAVPLHWFKEWRRGYNQSQLLAAALAEELAVPLLQPLRRCRWTRSQASLGRQERLHNLGQAFRLRPGFPFPRKGILLVDDVLTTGATLDACTRLLEQAGVECVEVLTLARG